MSVNAPGRGGTAQEAGGCLARRLEPIDAILRKHGNQRTALIAVLQEIQDTYRYLPEDPLNYVATALGLSPATVFAVATFYAQFSLEPKGKYLVRVCDGTACHVKNSTAV